MKNSTGDRTIGFISLGCPKNQVDLELMLARVIERGYSLTNRIENADIIVVNTCAFIGSAVDEADRNIRDALRYRRNGRCETLVVSGCLPQYLKDQAGVKYPEVDAFITPDEVLRLDEVIDRLQSRDVERVVVDENVRPPIFLYDDSMPRRLSTPPGMAYVKIAEGCSHRCSFCIIPQIRGRFRSRPIESIVREIEGLIGQGIREIVLISQDSTQYGRDLRDGTTNLASLYSRILRINGDFWVRTMYLYPNSGIESLLELVASHQERLLPYFDLPIQHINTELLRAMGRTGGKHDIMRCLKRIRRVVPGAVIRTNLIVGFPGETDAHFEELKEFVCEGRIDRLGVFAFSNHPGIPAYQVTEAISEREKLARRDALMRIQQEVTLRRNAELIGKTIRILIQDRRKVEGTNYVYVGRSYRDAHEIDGVVRARSKLRRTAGDFANVLVTKTDVYDLEATFLD